LRFDYDGPLASKRVPMKKPPKKVQAVEIFKHAETFYKSIDQLHKTDRNVIAAVSMPICVSVRIRIIS
jgi:hypothetical protein